MKKLFLLLVALSSFFILSCATTIPTVVQRPAQLDLGGAKSISVLPFQTSSYGDNNSISILGLFRIVLNAREEDDKHQITSYITSELTEELLDSDFLSIVSSRKVQSALEYNTPIPCDVYLTGYISRYDDDIDAFWDEDEERYYYRRSIDFTLVYEIIDAKSNYVISRKSKGFSRNSETEYNKRDLPNAFRLVRNDLDEFVSQLMKQLQPYSVTKYLSLIDDKDKMPEMKVAKNLAKDGNIQIAQEMYKTIYETKGSFEAGYNAAVLLQAQGRLEEAEELMSKLYYSTGERKAFSGLNDIKSEIQSANKLQKQLNQAYNN